MAAVYTYWWTSGVLKCPGRPDLGGSDPEPSTAAVPATIPFTI